MNSRISRKTQKQMFLLVSGGHKLCPFVTIQSFINISHMKYRRDLILGEAFCKFIFFYFLDSGLSVLNGLQFHFWLRDSENPYLRQTQGICRENTTLVK